MGDSIRLLSIGDGDGWDKIFLRDVVRRVAAVFPRREGGDSVDRIYLDRRLQYWG